MFVKYHDHLLKVSDFVTRPDGSRWLDCGLGFLINPEYVEIVTPVTYHS